MGRAGLVAVLLAGGLGTRMGDLAAQRPKHLLELAGEPVIVHQLRWLAGHGVVDVVLATAHLAEQFEPVLGDGRQWGVRLRYATEPSPMGTAGALRLALDALDTLPERVVVTNGDLLTGHNLTQQLARGEDVDTEVVLHIRTVPDARPYGCVVADPQGLVRAFVEKSVAPPTSEVNAGTYVIARSVIEQIPRAVTSLERDMLPRCVMRGHVVAYREQALWADIGTPQALVRASRELVLGSGRDRFIDPSASVAPDATVVDGSAIGAGATIGSGARVIGSVVMAGCVVGAGSLLVGAALAPGSRVPDGAVVTGSGREPDQ